MACEYCTNEEPLIARPNVLVFIDLETKELVVNYLNMKFERVVAYEPIHVCPMCGRDLSGDD